jgi:hypothetical protein
VLIAEFRFEGSGFRFEVSGFGFRVLLKEYKVYSDEQKCNCGSIRRSITGDK